MTTYYLPTHSFIHFTNIHLITYVPGILPGTWDKFKNKIDEIPYPQGAYILKEER